MEMGKNEHFMLYIVDTFPDDGARGEEMVYQDMFDSPKSAKGMALIYATSMLLWEEVEHSTYRAWSANEISRRFYINGGWYFQGVKDENK